MWRKEKRLELNGDFIDISDPTRVQKPPDQITEILSDGKFIEQGFSVNRIELRLYTEKHDDKLGPYSLITSIVQTDQGSIEMIYDEGFRGENSLERAKKFLIENLGISGLVLRSIITLKNKTQNST